MESKYLRMSVWCKPGQYLDHKNCICKNKLTGRLIGKCTRAINETMINNKGNIDNDNTITYVFIGLFLVLLLVGIVCFCVLAYFKWFKGKKLFKKNILIIKNYKSNYKMDIESLQIKNKYYYFLNNTIILMILI